MLDVPLGRPRRQRFQLLGIAMAVSVVLAFPMEQVTHSNSVPGSYWLQNSCGSTIPLLNAGLLLQAILAPLLVFLLPGPGGIFQRKFKVRASSSVRSTAPPAVRALARPVDHQRARKPAATSDARSLIAVVAMIIGIIGLLMLLRSGWQLRHIEFFSNPPASTSWSVLRSFAFSQTVLDLVIGLTGIGGAIYLLCQYLPSRAAPFMLVGWLSAAAIPFVWWYALRAYAQSRGLCPVLFDTSRPVDPYHIDLVQDCQRYFRYLSGFSAMWVGVTAGGLRLQAARAEEGGSAGNELQNFQNFFWLYLLGWAVQYRVSQWLMASLGRHNQEWITYSVLDFVYLTSSSLWSLAFIRFFWNLKARTRAVNFVVLFIASFAICLLTTLTFFWLFLWAPLALVPLFTLNVCGAAWALTVGAWRWRALQQPAPTVAEDGTQGQEKRPALLGLRAIEIVGLVVGVFMLIALVFAGLSFFWITYNFRHHH
jgi:hypothetical protein